MAFPIDPGTGKEHREFFEIDEVDGWVEVAPGIEAKVLAGSIDEAARKGHLNRLVRWAPHARIDEVKVHDFYEEVFVARGSLIVAAQTPPHMPETFNAPSFACRPPGALHGPFQAGPDGCLLFETQFYL
ncbi:cupin domain-containing protein [Azorhizobium caulinodans]|uniref:cupin domain-containing protein n=1 Tax=Azorhizobium caulinodans TaxID=7 RepID=UPI002FBD554F